MKKILIFCLLSISYLGFAQSSVINKEFSVFFGTWKSEVDGSPLTLNISGNENNLQFSLINVNNEEFVIKESKISKVNDSEYGVEVIKAAFVQYNDCIIKNAKITIKKLEASALSFSYKSEKSDCSFGTDTGLEIPNIEDLKFNKLK